MAAGSRQAASDRWMGWESWDGMGWDERSQVFLGAARYETPRE